jgi:hypothetical protein
MVEQVCNGCRMLFDRRSRARVVEARRSEAGLDESTIQSHEGTACPSEPMEQDDQVIGALGKGKCPLERCFALPERPPTHDATGRIE